MASTDDGSSGLSVQPVRRRRRWLVRLKVVTRIPLQYLVAYGSRARRRLWPVRADFSTDEIVVRTMSRHKLTVTRRAELQLWLGGKLRWREDWAEFDYHIVAEVDGRRLAHVGVTDRVATFDGVPTAVGLIGGVFTDDLFRDRGIASGLLVVACEDLAHRGLTHGALMCQDHLQAFYERLGWERVCGPLVFDWGWGPRVDRGCTMVLSLSADATMPIGLIDLQGRPA